VTDLLPPDAGRVFNVGRLDMASEGLILLTNDGELANHLTHPRYEVKKVYHVSVVGTPSRETLAELRKGVYLSEGKAHFVDATVKGKRKNGSVLEVVLDEGRNREIRRVLARVGHKVQRLKRVAVGPVRLGELPSGAYRELTAEEVKALRAAHLGPKTKSSPPPRKPQRKPSKPGQGRGAAPKSPRGPKVIGGEESAASPTAPTKKKAARHKKPDQKKPFQKKAAHKKAGGAKRGAKGPSVKGRPRKPGGKR